LGVLNQIHCSHAAYVVGVAHKFSAWGVQADFTAVAAHPAPTRFSSSLFLSARRSRSVVVDAVVILAQHRQVRRFGMTTILMRIDVVGLAPICSIVAVWPRTHQVFRHGQGAQLL